jgi:hypothetical protein
VGAQVTTHDDEPDDIDDLKAKIVVKDSELSSLRFRVEEQNAYIEELEAKNLQLEGKVFQLEEAAKEK